MAQRGNRVFLYCGKNSHGQFIEGRVRAENSQWAKYKLRKKGIKLQSLRKSWHLPFGQTQSIKGTEIAQFTRQLLHYSTQEFRFEEALTLLLIATKKPPLSRLFAILIMIFF